VIGPNSRSDRATPLGPDSRPDRVALLGAGVIGAGWAARMLIAGVDVRLFDPAPEAERTVLASLTRARRAWARLASAPPAPEGALTVHRTVAEAVAGAQLIQESAPEREPLKRALLAQADREADPRAVIASSTSGLLPSRLCLEDRGRDGSSLCCGLDPPPAQIPACTASALGSSLGFWRRTARRARDAGCGRAGAIEPRGGSSASS